MAKLHELLAAERTRTSSWNQMYADTLDKFKKADHYFNGRTRRLHLFEDTEVKEGKDANKAIEDAEREDKPVITTVSETLTDALEVFRKAEDLLFQRNKAKQSATGTVMWQGEPYLPDLPMDQLLGLESRLKKMKELWLAMPTQDATRAWKPKAGAAVGIYAAEPEETTKTDKRVIPIVLHAVTKEHPANVQMISKDVTIGRFTTTRSTGAVTALQKFEALKRLDEVLVEISSARQRANLTEAPEVRLADKLVTLLLEPLLKFS